MLTRAEEIKHLHMRIAILEDRLATMPDNMKGTEEQTLIRERIKVLMDLCASETRRYGASVGERP